MCYRETRPEGQHTSVPALCCCSIVQLPHIVKCLPHAIIIGAQKAGTTALFGHMLLRDDFEKPKRKEADFFGKKYSPVSGRGHQQPLRPWPHTASYEHVCLLLQNFLRYLRRMPIHYDNKFTIDATPSYMMLPSVASCVRDITPESKLLSILRDPVDRFESAYAVVVFVAAASGNLLLLLLMVLWWRLCW